MFVSEKNVHTGCSKHSSTSRYTVTVYDYIDLFLSLPYEILNGQMSVSLHSLPLLHLYNEVRAVALGPAARSTFLYIREEPLSF